MKLSNPAGNTAYTTVLSMIAPQVNRSSASTSRQDVAGNTYGEHVGQTRVTLSALRRRQISMMLSGRVDAGTGSFQLWNFTDSAELGVVTTTAVVETEFSIVGSSHLLTNVGDAITIRTRNSVANNTTFIDDGGMIEGDAFIIGSTQSWGTITGFARVGYGGPTDRVWVSSIQLALLRGFSTDTITFQLQHGHGVHSSQIPTTVASGDVLDGRVNIGATLSGADNGTVVTRTPVRRISPWGLVASVSAVTGGRWLVSAGMTLNHDDI